MPTRQNHRLGTIQECDNTFSHKLLIIKKDASFNYILGNYVNSVMRILSNLEFLIKAFALKVGS